MREARCKKQPSSSRVRAKGAASQAPSRLCTMTFVTPIRATVPLRMRTWPPRPSRVVNDRRKSVDCKLMVIEPAKVM